jgi:hypothetical protein
MEKRMPQRRFLLWVVVVAFGCGREPRITSSLDAGEPLPVVNCLDADGDGIPGTGSCEGEPRVDCKDNDPLAFPGASELCNGSDDDCDGELDEGLPRTAYYRDGDMDGVGSTLSGEGCMAPPAGLVTSTGDCNDTDATVRPGAAEQCNGVDDDCDGANDNGIPFQDFYPDVDGDGFGDTRGPPLAACRSTVMGRVPNRSDCNDTNPTVKPGASELCNRVDDNCDGQVDNGITFQSYYVDSDGDGFGAVGGPESSCAPVPGKVTNDSDCNDSHPSVKPGAPEICNGIDDSCDGQIDENLSFTSYYVDLDGDGFGAGQAQTACLPIAGRVTNASDCNDGDAMVKPGAPERCNDADDDCDGAPDDGLSFSNYFVDGDGDGFGVSSPSAINACAPVTGRVTNALDCNDRNAAIRPGIAETCNQVDDNCNGQSDEGLATQPWYPDVDGDGRGRLGSMVVNRCNAPPGYVSSNDDCDDANTAVRPGVLELCNGIDDDCDGQIDTGAMSQNYWVDGDGDGFGRSGSTPQNSCAPLSGWVMNAADCNDNNASVKPTASETCNGIDDNCNASVDEGLTFLTYYVDLDSDGFGQRMSTGQSSCQPLANRVTNDTDCNDGTSAIRPGATETCNATDDDCDGFIDEGNPGGGAACVTGQTGVCATGTLTCATGVVTCQRNTNPSPERCNGLDDDCSGASDESFSGLGTACTVGVGACVATGTTVCNAAQTGTRCSAIPGTSTPSACDGIDNDCDGVTDEPVLVDTVNVAATQWQDIEVQPFYYSAGGCRGGQGSGTDALAGGAMVMATGSTGVNFQRLNTEGVPLGAPAQFTSLTYLEIATAQAGDGFLVAGVWNVSPEIDLFYVDATTGIMRSFLYSQYNAGSGGTIDSLKVVRASGRSVVVLWRQTGGAANNGIRLARFRITGDGGATAFGIENTNACGGACTVVSSTSVPFGVGADSTFDDWSATQTCSSGLRKVGVSYLKTPQSLSFFEVNEDGTGKWATEEVVYSVSNPRSMAEPEVSHYPAPSGKSPWVVAYVTRDPGAAPATADLTFGTRVTPVSGAPYWSWGYAWLAYASENGIGSITRPSVTASSSQLWFAAHRFVADAAGLKRQVMTRFTDLTGARQPFSSTVEVPVTSGACSGDVHCRPGNKFGLASWAPFSRLYYSGSGATPAGAYTSRLTCN